MKVRRYQLIAASQGLEKLSGLGSKDRPTVKALAKLMMAVKSAAAESDLAQNTLIRGHAKMDGDGNIVTKENGGIVVENEAVFTLAVTDFSMEYMEIDASPITEEMLTLMIKYPDAQTLASLGPLVVLT